MEPVTIQISVSLWGVGAAIILSTLIVCDAYLYSKGHDTFFYKHKSKHEKAIREKQSGVKYESNS